MLFPTPPFPERTNTLCLTNFKRSLIAFNAGSGSFAFPEAQIYWLGHPSQADDFPAFSDYVPGHSLGAFSGTILEGSSYLLFSEEAAVFSMSICKNKLRIFLIFLYYYNFLINFTKNQAILITIPKFVNRDMNRKLKDY